jgi:hypothetical protein
VGRLTLYQHKSLLAGLGVSEPLGARVPGLVATDPQSGQFSGFDEDDNPAMSSLWPRPHPDGSWPKITHWRPFHVTNIALNIVSTKHLSWQERRRSPSP